MSYQVEKELSVPRHLLDVPIDPEVLCAFGFNPSTRTEDIMLAQIALQCGRYSSRWLVRAYGLTGIPGRLEEVGVMRCGEDIERERVLATADEWIRESTATICVPEAPLEILHTDPKFNKYNVLGITLIRANEFQGRIADQTPLLSAGHALTTN